MGDEQQAVGFTGRTSWSSARPAPLRLFIRTESGSAAVLLMAALAALVWANVDAASYERVWHTDLAVRLGHWGLSLDLREWINSGLMAFFFFVVGLEARREADLGELRELRRVALPLIAGLGGMLVPVGIYLAINAGTGTAHGWGAAMSTDTAFALGVLTLVGPRFSDRLRAFLLTVLVVDDIVALLVIAFAYSHSVALRPLLVAAGLFVAVLVAHAFGVRTGRIYLVLGVATWVAMVDSGVDPLVVGLAIGLLAYAYPAARVDLERASEQFRLFREQPTPHLARQATATVAAAISPNERLSELWHPWTSYVIVPLFALANVGLPLGAHFLATAFSSPVTLGILVGYVAGKPFGVAMTAMLVTTASRGRLRPPVGWGSVAGTGSVAGIGFTVSLLIASLAFDRTQLAEAKVGVLAAAVTSTLLSWLVFGSMSLLPTRLRARALLGTSAAIVDLAEAVDPDVDHIRGPIGSPVTVVEYGDLECPYCGQAEPVVRELLREFTDITYVWRHLPLDDVHPHARLAAEATEAAHAQGAFWQMHDRLLEHQDQLTYDALLRHAASLGLDVDRFADDVRDRDYASRVARDVDSADLSGVSGTPTFFVNGQRHRGAFDLDSLSAAVKAAGARAVIAG
jgi:Na+/H+ antiporter NhaA